MFALRRKRLERISHRTIFPGMTAISSNHNMPNDAHIESELARALRLSASLNNPDDHAIVAGYIAELEGRASRRQTEQMRLR